MVGGDTQGIGVYCGSWQGIELTSVLVFPVDQVGVAHIPTPFMLLDTEGPSSSSFSSGGRVWFDISSGFASGAVTAIAP